MRKFSKKVMAVLCAVLCAVALIVMSFGGFGSAYADTKPEKKPAVAVNYQEVPGKYRDAMKQAVEMGLITPDVKGSLRPNDVMTIAEYATVWHKLKGAWFNKKDAEDRSEIWGKIEIDGRDGKRHWAYLPLSYGCTHYYLGIFMTEFPAATGSETLVEKIAVDSKMKVNELMLYCSYGYYAIQLMLTEEHKVDNIAYLIDGRYDDFQVINGCYQKNSLLEKSLPKGNRDSFHTGVASGSCLKGIQLLQSSGVLPLYNSGSLNIDLSRSMTRAEVIYTILYVEDYLKSSGFTTDTHNDAREYRDYLKHYKNNLKHYKKMLGTL